MNFKYLFVFSLLFAFVNCDLACTPGFRVVANVFSDFNATGAQQLDPQLFNSSVTALGFNTLSVLNAAEAWFLHRYGGDFSGVSANPTGFPYKEIPGVALMFLILSNYNNLYHQHIGSIRVEGLDGNAVIDANSNSCISEREFIVSFALFGGVQYNGTYGARYPGANGANENAAYYGLFAWDINLNFGGEHINETKVFYVCANYPQISTRDSANTDRFHTPLLIDSNTGDNSLGIGDSLIHTFITPANSNTAVFKQRKTHVFPAQYDTLGIVDSSCIPPAKR